MWTTEDRARVERVKSWKFLSVHITDYLKWSLQTDSVVKAQQRLFNLKKLILAPKTLTDLYRCIIESILLSCITAWYGNCTVHNNRNLQRAVIPPHHQGHTACPPGQLQHPVSQESQEEKRTPSHPETVQLQQSWD
jgi:hypothetical protein